MTREELCIHACKYAIGELTRKGSSAFIISAHEGRQQITWVEVMEWLNRERREDDISRYGVLHKIAEFFSNWDGDENSKMEISVNDMREIADISVKKARAEWQLNKLRQEQQPKTGHWIEGQTDNPNVHNILCSCCFEGYPSKGHANSQYTRKKFKYCPNCGAKMVEPQEGGDKE